MIGAMLAVAGFFGDIVMSAMKRDPRHQGYRHHAARPWRHPRPRRQPRVHGAAVLPHRPLLLFLSGRDAHCKLRSLLRLAFFALVLRPFFLLAIGLAVRHRERLPKTGPLIIAANHNSHLDTLALMSLFPLRSCTAVHAVAGGRLLPHQPLPEMVRRRPDRHHPDRAHGEGRPRPARRRASALDRGDILIIFPEGSRGEPQTQQAFKRGIGHVRAAAAGRCRCLPVFLRGFGRVLPKGDHLPVPFFCDIVVGITDDRPRRGIRRAAGARKSMPLGRETPTPEWV